MQPNVLRALVRQWIEALMPADELAVLREAETSERRLLTMFMQQAADAIEASA